MFWSGNDWGGVSIDSIVDVWEWQGEVGNGDQAPATSVGCRGVTVGMVCGVCQPGLTHLHMASTESRGA